jgi:hypothetical protein
VAWVFRWLRPADPSAPPCADGAGGGAVSNRAGSRPSGGSFLTATGVGMLPEDRGPGI